MRFDEVVADEWMDASFCRLRFRRKRSMALLPPSERLVGDAVTGRRLTFACLGCGEVMDQALSPVGFGQGPPRILGQGRRTMP